MSALPQDRGSGTPPPASSLPRIGIGTGLWISPAGGVIALSGSHIDEIIAWPEKFGTRMSDLLSIHERYGERLHVEGRARHHIIRAVLFTGWIRLRHQRNYWSASVDDLGIRLPTVQAFFHVLHAERSIGIRGEVRIFSVRHEWLHAIDVCDLLEGFRPVSGPRLHASQTEQAEDLEHPSAEPAIDETAQCLLRGFGVRTSKTTPSNAILHSTR